MSLRRKIAWATGAILGSIVAAVAAAPYVIDVEAYKPAIIEAVRDATGRDLVIDGPVRLRMFPVPGIGAGQVHFANAVGAKGAQMVDVRWVAVRPAWWALLQGRIEVGTLTLYRPSIALETDAEGRPNWDFTPGAGTRQAAGAESAGFHLAIGRLSLVRGTVTYTDPKTKKVTTAEDVNISATVGSFDGPFTIKGSATINGVPLKLDLSVAAPGAKGHDTRLSLEASSGSLDFDGQLSAISNDMRVTGHLKVETGRLADFVAALVTATGGDKPAFEALAAGRFTFDGDIDFGPDRVTVSDFAATMGHDAAGGSLSLALKPDIKLDGHLKLSHLDLETWLDLLGKLGVLLSGPQPAKPPAKDAPLLPATVNAAVTIDADELLWRKEPMRDVSLAINIAKGVLTVPRLKATLPGDMKLQADGGFSLSGSKLRDTLTWLGIDVSHISKDRLQSLNASGKLTPTSGGLQVSNATFELDGAKGKGSGTLSFAPTVAATVNAEVESIDLDAYLPLPTTEPAIPSFISSTPSPAPPTALSIGIKAKVAKVVYRGQPLSDVEGDVAVQGNLLKLNDVKVADLLGGKLALKGSVNDFATDPKFDVSFSANAPDADRLTDYAGLPHFINGKIGAVAVNGAAAGTRTSVTLRDVAVAMLGANARASGKLDLGGELVAFDFPSFSLETQDVGRLVSAASGRNSSGMGPLSAGGSFRGTAQRVAFNGDLVTRGSHLIGTIDATLGERPSVNATLKVPGTLNVDQWFGVSSGASGAGGGAGSVSGTPIDLSGLRSFDANLSLFTSAISMASLRIDYGDVQANLSNGVLRITSLTGQFYGGAVAFVGTVDASSDALAIDLRGDVRGIYLSEMLRGTTGTNNFGNSDLRVTVDGKIDATGIHVASRGRSMQEIRDSMAANANLGGYIYPSVTQGSQSFALFAAGIASIFSESMAFNSQILQSFVNYQSTVGGQLQVNGTSVTTQNQTVQGQNATAYVTSRTDIGVGMTDTTIRVSGGNGQFVTTVKGPLSSPSLTTARAN